jgi:hypothetical protein
MQAVTVWQGYCCDGQARTQQVLASDLARMQTVTFSATVPEGIGDALLAHVTFMDADQCTRFAPICRTMYVTYTFPREQLHMMTSWMPRNGLVVLYA